MILVLEWTVCHHHFHHFHPFVMISGWWSWYLGFGLHSLCYGLRYLSFWITYWGCNETGYSGRKVQFPQEQYLSCLYLLQPFLQVHSLYASCQHWRTYYDWWLHWEDKAVAGEMPSWRAVLSIGNFSRHEYSSPWRNARVEVLWISCSFICLFIHSFIYHIFIIHKEREKWKKQTGK